MNEMEICKHLDLKFNEFLQKIKCPRLTELLAKKLYFAGGCIYCLRNDKVVKDYDMFLICDDIIEELKNLEIWSFTSDYALTCGKFQIVTKYFGEPDSCVGQFDFKHNMHYYFPGSNKIMCAYSNEFLDEEPDFDRFVYLKTNELHFNENRARDIEDVWLRIEKFINRGMTVSEQTKKKIKQKTSKKKIKAYKKSRHHGNRDCY